MKTLIISDFEEVQENKIVEELENFGFQVSCTFLQVNASAKAINKSTIKQLFNNKGINCNINILSL